MIRLSALRRQLLLIRTNLGYGTALTAACARQGCSAIIITIIIIIIITCNCSVSNLQEDIVRNDEWNSNQLTPLGWYVTVVC
jgi:hypothetical protein